MSEDRRAFFRAMVRSAAGQAGRAAGGGGARRAAGLSDDEVERYSRQLVLPEWSEAAQLALREASVLVVGAGALGSPVAAYLAGRGRRAARDRRLRRRRALEPPPPDAALHARPRRAEGRERGGQAALPQPGDRRRALPGALRAGDARGRRPRRRLLGLLRDPLRGQRAPAAPRASPLVEGGVVGLSGPRDGDPAGGERVLPLRVPGAAAARAPRRPAPRPACSAPRRA